MSQRKIISAAIADNQIPQLIKLNCTLKNLTNSRQFSAALRLFQQIHSSHSLKPDQYTLSTAITLCAHMRDTALGIQLHSHSIKSGLKFFPHVSNPLLSMYAKSHKLGPVKRVFDEIKVPDSYSYTTMLSACMKLGEVDYACQMFDQMPGKENVAVWNAMITGCAENGHDYIAFDLFYEMHVLGVRADNYTFASVLSLCCFDVGKIIHCLIVKTGFLERTSVINSLITMYFDYKSPVDSYRVFEEVGREWGDEITYNAVIAGMVKMGRDDDALSMFKDMLVFGINLTELTFVSVMGSCSYFRVATQIHGYAIKIALADCTSVSNAAITMYSNSGDLNAAVLVFKRLGEKDIVSWNAIIAGYSVAQLGSDVMFLYLDMQRNGVKSDEFTIGSFLASTESLESVEMIKAIVVKTALIVRVEVSNALISAFSRHGEINQASKVFSSMNSRNIITWNAMISGFQLNGFPENGLQKFFELVYSGSKPNHYTLSLVLCICSSMSDVQQGKQVHAYILKFGYLSYTLLGNALISLYSKCGVLDWCLGVFNCMSEKDVVSWNSIISAYAQHGEGKEAVHCFNEMQNCIIEPDSATFTCVLSACSRSGLLAEGIQIFDVMVNKHRIEPESDHFSCIIDLLSRAGFLDLAERVFDNSKGVLDIDSSVWWTLFSSCAANGNLQLGSIVGEFLLEKGDNDPSAVYVVLSNLYANAGKWGESANVRELMKKYGVTKQRGSSWTG